MTRPREVDCDVFDMPYVCVEDARVERGVEESLSRFLAVLRQSNSSHGRVCLSFYARTVRKGWFSSKEEKAYWERWVIPLRVVQPAADPDQRQRQHEARRAALRDRLVFVVRSANEKKAHLPPVPKSSVASVYPFEISFSGGDSQDESWGFGSAVRRMLQQGPPQLLNK